MALEPEELIQLAASELRRHSLPSLTLDLTAENALAFLGMLQLVVRHPDLPETMTELAREIADTIECQLSSCGPAVREICRQGWNTDLDEDLG